MIHIHCGLVESLEKESIWLKGFPLLMEKVGSATPGKLSVQNDLLFLGNSLSFLNR